MMQIRCNKDVGTKIHISLAGDIEEGIRGKDKKEFLLLQTFRNS